MVNVPDPSDWKWDGEQYIVMCQGDGVSKYHFNTSDKGTTNFSSNKRFSNSQERAGNQCRNGLDYGRDPVEVHLLRGQVNLIVLAKSKFRDDDLIFVI